MYCADVCSMQAMFVRKLPVCCEETVLLNKKVRMVLFRTATYSGCYQP